VRGVILGPGEGVSVANPVGGALTFKIGSAETDGALTAFESISAPAMACVAMKCRSAARSSFELKRIRSGMAILPTSWRRAAKSRDEICSGAQ